VQERQEACAILSSSHESVSVLAEACCGVCPRIGNVVVFDDAGASSVISAADPVSAATELLGGACDPTLVAACASPSDARASPSASSFPAVLHGDAVTALLQRQHQAPLEVEPRLWEDSTWHRQLDRGSLLDVGSSTARES